jgi:uncharacterized membrane protein
MTWLFVALAGYLFNAVAAIFDKFLLSDRIKAPAAYAFYVSIFSLFALGFILTGGFQWSNGVAAGISILSGAVFLYALVAFYVAVKRHEVSRVAPLVGTVSSIAVFVAALLPGLAGSADVNGALAILSLLLLIGGGLLISFDLPFRRGEHIPILPVLAAGIGMGLSLFLLKEAYAESNFVTGLVWSRIGMFVGGMSLLFVPTYRRDIFGHTGESSAAPKRAASTGAYFILNKTCAGVGTFLVSYAISLGSVAFVQALSGMQYVFLLMIAFPLSFRFPAIYGEKLLFWDWFQKVVAIAIIGFGLWVASTSGVIIM